MKTRRIHPLGAALTLLVTIAAVACVAIGNAHTTQAKPLRSPTPLPKKAAQAQSATVLIYMNGSDLESYAGEASADIAEMLASGVGDNVNVVLETLGTRSWKEYGIASDHSQRYRVNKGSLELVDDSLGQLDTTSAQTLSDFIGWGTSTYPADRYMLLFWNHGAGPVYGFGYDEFQNDYAALTLDEIQAALKQNANVHFDMIGMDCCLMSSMETCYVLQPYCDYAVLSEDFEPGIGWSYKNWLNMLEQNPSVSTVELGTTIVDNMMQAVSSDPENGDATLALIDESVAPALYASWVIFAYANKDALLATNYSHDTAQRGRPGWPFHTDNRDQNEYGYPNDWSPPDEWDMPNDWDSGYEMWDNDMSYVTMSDYSVTDIMEVASQLGSTEAEELKQTTDNAIVHFGRTSGETNMTGIGVTLPYADAEFYDELVRVFSACGFDQEYIDWLRAFVEVDAGNEGQQGSGPATTDSGYPMAHPQSEDFARRDWQDQAPQQPGFTQARASSAKTCESTMGAHAQKCSGLYASSAARSSIATQRTSSTSEGSGCGMPSQRPMSTWSYSCSTRPFAYSARYTNDAISRRSSARQPSSSRTLRYAASSTASPTLG